MNNTIEFVLRMKDMMSSNITRVSSTSQSAFNRMSQSANQMTGRNRVLAMSFTELQNKIRQVEDTISRSTVPSQIAAARRELAQLQRMSNNHAGNVNNGSSGGLGVGGVAGGTILGNIATQGIAMIGSGIGSMIQGAMDKETSINGMSTFLGKKGANEAYGNIEKDAEATPFDTASLLMVNRSLISAGLNAKSARVDSMNLANAIVAVGGSNDTLTRMAANMQQIKTVGKATAMDIKQFGMAGVNIYDLLAKSTGKSVDQVKEMDVSYEQLSAALSMSAAKGGLYYGALENTQNSMQGKWSNFQEKMTNTLASIGTAFAPLIMGVMDLGTSFLTAGTHLIDFANWLNSGTTGASIFITVLAGLTAGYVAYLAIMGGMALWTGIVTKAQLLWNLALTANPIGLVIVGLVALAAGVAVAYNKFEKFRAIVDGVWGVLKEVGSLIKSILTGNLSGIASSLKNIFTGKSFKEGYDMSINRSTVNKHLITVEKAKQVAKDKANDTAKTGALGSGAAAMAGNAASGKTAGDTVSGAGPKVVNIHVGKFFDTIQFTTLNAKESAQELENMVMESLVRVLYNGSKMV